MTAISANTRLCQGARLLLPCGGSAGGRSTSSSASHLQISAVGGACIKNKSFFGIKNNEGVNSLVSQISTLRLAPISTTDVSASPFSSSSSSSVPFSTSSFSSSPSSVPYASFHSSITESAARKKKPQAEVVRPLEELPEKPKRPISSWLEFCGSNRPLVRRAQPELQPTEVMRVLAEMWKRMNPSEKEKYAARYRRRCQEYEKAMESWNASISEAEKASIVAAEKEKRVAKEKAELKSKQRREQKALMEDLGKPKKPLTTYFRFMQEQRVVMAKTTAGSFDVKQFAKNCAEKYKNLPPYEVERLSKRYNADKKSYEVALEAWNKKMTQDGRSVVSFSGGRG